MTSEKSRDHPFLVIWFTICTSTPPDASAKVGEHVPNFQLISLLLFLRPLPVQLLLTVEVPGLYMELAATDFLAKSDLHAKNLFLAIL
jgi:hypothetical protein